MVTKSGFLYTVSGKLNGKDFSKEIRSFKESSVPNILGEIIQGQTAISLSNVVTSQKEVLYGISDEEFLTSAKILKDKTKNSDKEKK